jgi:hypothetical protein
MVAVLIAAAAAAVVLVLVGVGAEKSTTADGAGSWKEEPEVRRQDDVVGRGNFDPSALRS